MPRLWLAIGSQGHSMCHSCNVPESERLNAPKCWTLEDSESSDEFRNRYFHCGEGGDGKSVKVKMKHFLKYL